MAIQQSCIVYDDGERLIVDTSLPHANMMHDAARQFAVCRYLRSKIPGRVTCLGRYETLAKAKKAVRYLRPGA